MTNPAAAILDEERVSWNPTDTGVDMVIHLDTAWDNDPRGTDKHAARWSLPLVISGEDVSSSLTRPSCSPAHVRDVSGHRRRDLPCPSVTPWTRCPSVPSTNCLRRGPSFPSRWPPRWASPRRGHGCRPARQLRAAAWASTPGLAGDHAASARLTQRPGTRSSRACSTPPTRSPDHS